MVSGIDRPAEAFIVGIIGPAGRAVGVGALVGPREVVTCAHVVNAALGREPRSQEPPAERVTVAFAVARRRGSCVGGRGTAVAAATDGRDGGRRRRRSGLRAC